MLNIGRKTKTNHSKTTNRDWTIKKRICGERSWCKQGIRYFKRNEYEIIDKLKSEYPITKLCNLMDVNRSGYYKWKARYGHKNVYEQNRDLLTNALHEAHIKHISYGYHRLATIVINETG